MPNSVRVRWLSAAALAVLLVGCGGSSSKDTSSGTQFEGALGSPASASKATRTIDVQAGDNLRFTPDSIQVKVGETVTFKVDNKASIMHDFTLGDQPMQDQHEKEMSSMGAGMAMSDEPNALHIAPGASKSLTWTFTRAGTTLFGCHEPGHFAAGMKGTITVTS